MEGQKNTFENFGTFSYGSLYKTTNEQQQSTWFLKLIEMLKKINIGSCEVEK